MKMNEIKKRVELYEDNEQALDNLIKDATKIIESAKNLKRYNELDQTNHKKINEVLRAFNTNDIKIEWTTDALWVVRNALIRLEKSDLKDTLID